MAKARSAAASTRSRGRAGYLAGYRAGYRPWYRAEYLAWGLGLGLGLGSAACGSDPPPAEPSSTPVLPVESTPLPAFSPVGPLTYVSKVKNLLVGQAPTDDEAQQVTRDAAALAPLIDGWMKTPEFQAKMFRFFQNSFQQGQLNRQSLVDQVPDQGIDTRLLDNLQASFALTVLQLTMVEGRPFTEALTADRFMLTPPLAMLLAYMDNKHISDVNRGTDYIVTANPNFQFTLTNKSGPIPIEKTLDPADPLFMTWYLPTAPTAPCPDPLVYKKDTTRLYQSFLGVVSPPAGTCTVNITTAPQFVAADYAAWRMVRIRAPKAGEATTLFYDLPKMRAATELVLRVPRVGFFSTPAFFANWATNSANQARVTMNQTLIVALGRSFDDSNNTVPLSSPALDAKHAADPACYACHKTLDPMRQVFRQAFTLAYHEQKDPAQANLPGVFALDGVTRNIANPRELGESMASHPRFAIAWTQKLCYWANSAPCSESDPEFQRVATAFENSGFSWKALVRELLSSPLVTGAKNTLTFADQGLTISVARRDQLCAAMSSRLGLPNVCALGRAPVLTQLVPSDGYARGATAPILATDPSLFYRAATEQLCRSFADSAVDATISGQPSRYSSRMADAAISDMVRTIMAILPADPRYPVLRQILADHFSQASKTAGISATDALKSTFVLACAAPPSISIGL